MKKIIKNIFLVLICCAFSLSAFFLGIIAMFVIVFGMKFKVLVYTSVLVVVLYILFFFVLILTKSKTKKRMIKVFTVTAVLSGILIVSSGTYDLYNYFARVIDNSAINTNEYLPFKEESKIARLTEKSSLKFTNFDYLPIVDGAAALFPMYSSFVNATYPSNIAPLNYSGGPFTYNNTSLGNRRLFKNEIDIMFGVDASSQFSYYKENEKIDKNYEIDFSINQTPIGKEGFVFFVNSGNTIDSLTLEQIRNIYLRKITNWKEVGGKDVEILPYRREINSGSEVGFSQFIGSDIPRKYGEKEYVASGMGGIINVVADYHNYPGAIGFSYFHYASELKANRNIKILKIDGVEPSTNSIGDDSYRFTSEFYAITRSDNEKENVKKLIEWILSYQGQYLVEKSGYGRIK